MIDVQMRVQHIADVAHPQAMLGKLVLDHVLVELQTAHARAISMIWFER